MARQIYEHNIPELQFCYSRMPRNTEKSSMSPLIDTHHPELGSFYVSSLGFPNLNVLDMSWAIPDDLEIHESQPSETVDINFVLEGNVEGTFRGLNAKFGMHTGTNNLKYTPTEKSTHRAARQDARMFVISLEKEYFCNLIGADSSWTENMQRQMESDLNFIASPRFLNTSPQMRALIHAIRTVQPGPMSKLLSQSMVFELLALQMQQLAAQTPTSSRLEGVSHADAERLHVVKQYIDRNFLSELSLSALCREGMLNEFKLKKGFKALFGTSVISYARQLRMTYAQTLLRDHRMSIEEVASCLGYQYPNHFSVAYKKFFGIVPSQR